MAELWDAYYLDGTKAGFDLVRGRHLECQGVYHLVCQVIVRHTDGSFLLMQRDWNKEGWPGMWECTAGGSALKGEDRMQCARRELEEETGLIAGEMQELGRTVYERSHSIVYDFLCVLDCDKSSIRLQEGETIAHKWLPPEEFRAFLQGGEIVRSNAARMEGYAERIFP